MLNHKPFGRRLIKVAIQIIIIAIVMEIGARLITENDWFLNTTSQFSSVRWRLLWIKSHNSSEATNYPIDAYHPLLGWYPIKNSQNVPSSGALVSFNSDGIRGQKNYTLDKPPNTSRIVIIGDSFTFGEGVNDSDTYAAQLENLIPNSEVLNMGVHGYGLDQMALRLRLDGFKYHPDIVIYAFIGDDINRIVLDFRDYMKPRYILVNNKLKLVNTPITKPEDLLSQSHYSSLIPSALQLMYDRVVYRSYKYSNLEPLTVAILKQVVSDTENHGSIPIILFLPTGQEMTEPLGQKVYGESLMFLFCKSINITCFSARSYLVPAFENGNKYNIDINIHYQPITYWLIANGLAKDLIAKYPMLQVQNGH